MALSSLGPASKWREFSGSHVVIEEMAKKLSGQSCINRGEILAHRHSRGDFGSGASRSFRESAALLTLILIFHRPDCLQKLFEHLDPHRRRNF